MNIEDMMLVKLREVAKEKGIKNISKYKKVELIHCIKDLETPALEIKEEQSVTKPAQAERAKKHMTEHQAKEYWK